MLNEISSFFSMRFLYLLHLKFFLGRLVALNIVNILDLLLMNNCRILWRHCRSLLNYAPLFDLLELTIIVQPFDRIGFLVLSQLSSRMWKLILCLVIRICVSSACCSVRHCGLHSLFLRIKSGKLCKEEIINRRGERLRQLIIWFFRS